MLSGRTMTYAGWGLLENENIEKGIFHPRSPDVPNKVNVKVGAFLIIPPHLAN